MTFSGFHAIKDSTGRIRYFYQYKNEKDIHLLEVGIIEILKAVNKFIDLQGQQTTTRMVEEYFKKVVGK